MTPESSLIGSADVLWLLSASPLSLVPGLRLKSLCLAHPCLLALKRIFDRSCRHALPSGIFLIRFRYTPLGIPACLYLAKLLSLCSGKNTKPVSRWPKPSGLAGLWHTGGHPPNISPRSWYSLTDFILQTMPGSYVFDTGLIHPASRSDPASLPGSSSSFLCKSYLGILSSGILTIKRFLGEVENISGPAPDRDMRTVTDVPVSVVISLRLPRAHLMHRSGSH